MIQASRVRKLNDMPERPGRFILYWMQQSQRAEWNHALEYAIDRANERGLPVVAVFGLTADYPDANLRHYTFLAEGLRETGMRLAARGIRLVVRLASPDKAALALAKDAALLVADRGYLRHQAAWRDRVAREAPCPAVEVESDAVVPVDTASDHEEYAARTLRPRIYRALADYLVPVVPRQVERDSLGLSIEGVDLSAADALLAGLPLDRSVDPVGTCRGGASEAERRLDDFLDRKLTNYGNGRNDPASDGQSGLSPYLHFGQISPLRVALAVAARAHGHEAAAEAFLEELIIRRELALNFVRFNAEYDRYDSLPGWALGTLAKHAGDPREIVYERETLEQARTHDPYWNAAMTEMRRTGRMHGYMRMYWGKKILEWTSDPRTAFDLTLALNNKYFLDGRDPISFASVAWLFGKHDLPWAERPVFGTVRYMNASGLSRKFNMQPYLDRFK